MQYSEKLKDPRWQKKRLEILNRDGFKCQLCLSKITELHIHHKKYSRGREPWDYEDDVLITYCKYCHRLVELSAENVTIIRNQVFASEFGPTLIVSFIRNEYGYLYSFHQIQNEYPHFLFSFDQETIKSLLTLSDLIPEPI